MSIIISMVAQYNYWEKCLASPIPRPDNSKKSVLSGSDGIGHIGM